VTTLLVTLWPWGHLCINRNEYQVYFLLVSLEFFSDITLLVTLWPWGHLCVNRNEYQVYFLLVSLEFFSDIILPVASALTEMSTRCISCG